MDIAQVADQPLLPFVLLWSRPSRPFDVVEGNYDAATQRWAGADLCSFGTYSRSTTTGSLRFDRDEDKDDESS